MNKRLDIAMRAREVDDETIVGDKRDQKPTFRTVKTLFFFRVEKNRCIPTTVSTL